MIISGITRAYNNHFNPDQIAQDLISGRYYLVSFGNCHAPLLRKVARVNDAQQDEKTKAEWEFTTNPLSESLTSDLKFLIDRVPTPVFVSAAIRQEADPSAPTPAKSDKADNKKEKEPQKFWLKIQSLFDDKWDTPLPLTVEVLVDG